MATMATTTDSQLADIDCQSGGNHSFLPPMGDIEIQMYRDDEFGISHPAALQVEIDNDTFESPCGECQGEPPAGILKGVTRRPNASSKGLGGPETARRPPPAKRKAKRKAACEVEKLTRIDARRIRTWKLRTIAVALVLGLIASVSLYFVVARQNVTTDSETTVLVAGTLAEASSAIYSQVSNVGQELAQLVAATALTTNASSLANVTVDLWDELATQFREDYPFVEWIGWTPDEGLGDDGSHDWRASPTDWQDTAVTPILTPSVLESAFDASTANHEHFLTRTVKGIAPDGSREQDGAAYLSFWMQPIVLNSSDAMGAVALLLNWEALVAEMATAPNASTTSVCVVRNSCGEVFTIGFQQGPSGRNATFFVGEGDWHNVTSGSPSRVVPFESTSNGTGSGSGGGGSSAGSACEYSFALYGSIDSVSTSSSTTLAIAFAVIAAVVALLLALAFIQYDRYVSKQNGVIEATAKQESALLASLFPTNVAKRLFAEEKQKSLLFFNTKNRVKCYLDEQVDGKSKNSNRRKKRREMYINRFVGKPIAETFPETTIMFADITGFTSWSSTRNPEAVLRLLECIYRAFDMIARAQRVYKVETIGDSYVAVAGLPDPRRDHAVAMARFARDIMAKMSVLVRKLEVVLGPDTADLQLRIGLHSGSVTGGVLRGDRARFQLFGDTMNTASRMVSTSQPGKIQLSQETTDLLIAAGKFQWIELRDSTVVAKGKGEMQTYWLNLAGNNESSRDLGYHPADVGLDLSSVVCGSGSVASGRMDRLIGWNTECLLKLLRQVVAKRESTGGSTTGQITTNERRFTRFGETVIHEVKDVIALPANKFAGNQTQANTNADASASPAIDPEEVEFSIDVVDQVYDFVSNIAAMYKPENPFHNFEHASNSVMAMVKYLTKVDATAGTLDENGVDCSLGISADPLAQFACVVAALIHDVDHAGVPNARLVKEQAPIAEFYKGRCPAEQNAVDLAWQVLMDDAYIDLRELIYTNDEELQRFRSIVVNGVMATDVVDAGLRRDRAARWARAYAPAPSQKAKTRSASNGGSSVGSGDSGGSATLEELTNRKATVVLEYLVLASDVCHALQPWHMYRKWDELSFMEHYKAYMEGRADNVDPVTTWYEGELASFDFVVIPLAKRMRDSGVFGTSGDEYLSFALRNRAEWEDRGRAVLDEMSNLARRTYGML